MEAARTSVTLVNVYRSTRRLIPTENHLQRHRRGNPRPPRSFVHRSENLSAFQAKLYRNSSNSSRHWLQCDVRTYVRSVGRTELACHHALHARNASDMGEVGNGFKCATGGCCRPVCPVAASVTLPEYRQLTASTCRDRPGCGGGGRGRGGGTLRAHAPTVRTHTHTHTHTNVIRLLWKRKVRQPCSKDTTTTGAYTDPCQMNPIHAHHVPKTEYVLILSCHLRPDLPSSHPLHTRTRARTH
jgi:hypothetical protein